MAHHRAHESTSGIGDPLPDTITAVGAEKTSDGTLQSLQLNDLGELKVTSTGGGGPTTVTNDGTFAFETGGNLDTIAANTTFLAAVDFATETTLQTLALESGGNLDDIKTNTDNLDVALSTRASEATLLLVKADLDSIAAEDFATETTLLQVAASLAVIDDWDESDRAKVNPIVGQAGIAGGTGTAGANTTRVAIATNANDVDVTSFPSNLISSTVFTASGQNLEVTPGAAGQISIHITGVWSGLISFFVSTDTLTLVAVPVLNMNTNQQVFSTAVNGMFRVNVNGVARFRIASSAWVSGTADVFMERSYGTGSVVVENAISSKNDLTPSSPTAVSIGVTSTAAVSANTSRKGLHLVNTSDSYISIAFGATAVLNSGITLNPQGGAYWMDEYSFDTGAVNAIASGANANLAIQEYS